MYKSNFDASEEIFCVMKRKIRGKERKVLSLGVCNFNTFEKRLDSGSELDYLYEFCEGNFSTFFSSFRHHQHKPTPNIIYTNILDKYFMQYEILKEKKLYNFQSSSSVLLLGEKKCIFYEKEVVLRAYVYSSNFINREITGAHTQKIRIKPEKICLRLQFL